MKAALTIERRLQKRLQRMVHRIVAKWSLTDFQSAEVARIIAAEAPNIELLMGQLAKTRQQLVVARKSGVFDEAHARALEHNQAQVKHELAETRRRVREMVSQIPLPDRALSEFDWRTAAPGASAGAGVPEVLNSTQSTND